MFRAVNVGNRDLNIHKYNGGLFADDPVLDGLKIPDEVFGLFRDLAEYDFRPPSVVADAEVVSDVPARSTSRSWATSSSSRSTTWRSSRPSWTSPSKSAADPRSRKPSRKSAGASAKGRFTRPPTSRATSSSKRWAASSATDSRAFGSAKAEKAKAAVRSVLDDPRAYDLDSLKAAQREALLAFWLDWQHELGSIRILDPACGSGAS